MSVPSNPLRRTLGVAAIASSLILFSGLVWINQRTADSTREREGEGADAEPDLDAAMSHAESHARGLMLQDKTADALGASFFGGPVLVSSKSGAAVSRRTVSALIPPDKEASVITLPDPATRYPVSEVSVSLLEPGVRRFQVSDSLLPSSKSIPIPIHFRVNPDGTLVLEQGRAVGEMWDVVLKYVAGNPASDVPVNRDWIGTADGLEYVVYPFLFSDSMKDAGGFRWFFVVPTGASREHGASLVVNSSGEIAPKDATSPKKVSITAVDALRKYLREHPVKSESEPAVEAAKKSEPVASTDGENSGTAAKP